MCRSNIFRGENLNGSFSPVFISKQGDLTENMFLKHFLSTRHVCVLIIFLSPWFKRFKTV